MAAAQRAADGVGEKRKRGGNGNNKPTLTLAEQLVLEDVEPLDPATFRLAPCVFDGIPKKEETTFIDPYIDRLFDNLWDTQRTIPQLRTYLRPPAIKAAIWAQIDEELPPLSKKFNKKGEQVTLVKMYDVYISNRRNQEKVLKRNLLTKEGAALLDEGKGAKLAREAPLSAVTNVIDVDAVDPTQRVKAEARTAWLLKVKAEAVQVKAEALPGPEAPAEKLVAAAAKASGLTAVQVAAAAAAAEQVMASMGLSGVPARRVQVGAFSGRQRAKAFSSGGSAPVAASATPAVMPGPPVPPLPPAPVRQSSPGQLRTTKVDNGAKKAAADRERSASAREPHHTSPPPFTRACSTAHTSPPPSSCACSTALVRACVRASITVLLLCGCC
jgi:hypothetical protein